MSGHVFRESPTPAQIASSIIAWPGYFKLLFDHYAILSTIETEPQWRFEIHGVPIFLLHITACGGLGIDER
jgi:hypothetical protein